MSQLATRNAGAAPGQQGVIEPSAALADSPHRHPDPAATTLSHAAPGAAWDGGTALVLERMIRKRVIPELIARRLGPAAPPEGDHPGAAILAEALLADRLDTALGMMGDCFRTGISPLSCYVALVEPTARRLGDLWMDDVCNEFEVTLALCHMQMFLRRFGRERPGQAVPYRAPRTALVMPQPGEPHILGARVISDVLLQTGWTPRCEFPVDDTALRQLIAATWFDAIHLWLSPAVRRENAMPRLVETIRLARSTSLNPGVVIAVGGRIFAEGALPGDVGADRTSTMPS